MAQNVQQQVRLFHLDPGFGPLDYKAWIATTTAGTGQFTPTDGNI